MAVWVARQRLVSELISPVAALVEARVMPIRQVVQVVALGDLAALEVLAVAIMLPAPHRPALAVARMVVARMVQVLVAPLA